MSSVRARLAVLLSVAIALTIGAVLLNPSPPELLRKEAGRSDGRWWDPVVRESVGLFNPITQAASDAGSSPELQSLGYLQGYEPPGSGIGVVHEDPRLALKGYNLYSSGHAPEARLIDMRGKLLHAWKYDFAKACPGSGSREDLGRLWWRRVRLLPGGDLLAIYESMGLIRIDRDSKLIWARCGAYHHDLTIDREGRIWVLRAQPGTLDLGDSKREVVEDFVEVMTSNGESIRQFSLLRAFADSPYRSFLQRVSRETPDIFHTNSLKILTGAIRSPENAFASGNLLVSMRNIDVVATVDPERQVVTWALSGLWHAQHEPIETDEGTIVVFDNIDLDRSKVIELDPLTQQVLWTYQDGFFSPFCGSNQRLANGNTLVLESTAGRAFEVTNNKRIVWDFRSPHRVRRDGQELIALLPAIERVDPAAVDGWLQLER